MKIYGAAEAAAELGVDPRALRRFLRASPSYRDAGLGGRYQFQGESELASLRHAYQAWQRERPAPKPAQRTAPASPDPRILCGDPGVPKEKLGRHGLLPSVRAERAEARAGRQARLRARMGEVLSERYDDEPAGP